MEMLPISRLAMLIAVFAATVLIALGLGWGIGARFATKRRLPEATSVAAGALALRSDMVEGRWSRIIDTLERRGIWLGDTNMSALTERLALAGYSHPLSPRAFTLVRIVLTLGLPLVFLATIVLTHSSMTPLKLYFFGSLLALSGLYLPKFWISLRASDRRRRILEGFPDALDLMLVCVEAGLGLEAALDRVGRELSMAQPLISELFGAVVLELRAGRTREDALRNLSRHAGVDEIRSFTTLLIQSDKLGSSIGQTLRVYAAEMREKRRLRAEEKAHRLPVLLSIPLVTCMLPVMIGVLMLPAAIRVVRQVIPIMTHGAG